MDTLAKVEECMEHALTGIFCLLEQNNITVREEKAPLLSAAQKKYIEVNAGSKVEQGENALNESTAITIAPEEVEKVNDEHDQLIDITSTAIETEIKEFESKSNDDNEENEAEDCVDQKTVKKDCLNTSTDTALEHEDIKANHVEVVNQGLKEWQEEVENCVDEKENPCAFDSLNPATWDADYELNYSEELGDQIIEYMRKNKHVLKNFPPGFHYKNPATWPGNYDYKSMRVKDYGFIVIDYLWTKKREAMVKLSEMKKQNKKKDDCLTTPTVALEPEEAKEEEKEEGVEKVEDVQKSTATAAKSDEVQKKLQANLDKFLASLADRRQCVNCGVRWTPNWRWDNQAARPLSWSTHSVVLENEPSNTVFLNKSITTAVDPEEDKKALNKRVQHKESTSTVIDVGIKEGKIDNNSAEEAEETKTEEREDDLNKAEADHESTNTAVKPKEKPRKAPIDLTKYFSALKEVKQCERCGVQSTTHWRRDDQGNNLCNYCGLYPKTNESARPQTGLTCSHCKTTNTPLWRWGESGARLCNMCGVWYEHYQVARPLTWKKMSTQSIVLEKEPRDTGVLDESTTTAVAPEKVEETSDENEQLNESASIAIEPEMKDLEHRVENTDVDADHQGEVKKPHEEVSDSDDSDDDDEDSDNDEDEDSDDDDSDDDYVFSDSDSDSSDDASNSESEEDSDVSSDAESEVSKAVDKEEDVDKVEDFNESTTTAMEPKEEMKNKKDLKNSFPVIVIDALAAEMLNKFAAQEELKKLEEQLLPSDDSDDDNDVVYNEDSDDSDSGDHDDNDDDFLSDSDSDSSEDSSDSYEKVDENDFTSDKEREDEEEAKDDDFDKIEDLNESTATAVEPEEVEKNEKDHENGLVEQRAEETESHGINRWITQMSTLSSLSVEEQSKVLREMAAEMAGSWF